MSLLLEGVSVELGGSRILHDITFDVAEGETLAILGPSGSGKSTLLRAVAGLVPTSEGRISLDGADLAGVAVHHRRFGVVFQSYALFDHLDVAGNVGFGPRMAGLRGRPLADAVTAALERVGLAGIVDRDVATLSGGERQRVALARALVVDPVALLLDEPLGAVDTALKEVLLAELAGIVATRTTLYVTHDHDEALTIGGRVALLRDGRLVAMGTPERLWSEPPDPWSARFLGHPNVYEDGGPFATHPVLVPERSIRVDPAGPLGATVTSSRFAGDGWRIAARADGHTVVFRSDEPIDPGTGLRLSWADELRWGA